MNIDFLKRHKRAVVFSVIGVIILYLLLFDFNRFISIINWVLGVFNPLIIGGCIAFTLNLLMVGLNRLIFNRIHFKKNGTRDSLSLLTAVILLILMLFILLWFIIPQLVESLRLLADSIPRSLDYLRDVFDGLLAKYPGIHAGLASFPVKLDDIINNAVSYVQSLMSSTINQTYTVASNAIGTLFTVFVGLMFSFFLLLYKEKLGRQCRQLLYTYLPEKTANNTLYVFHLAYKDFSAFIYGQVIGAAIQFVLFLAIALIFRLPYSLMLAVIMAIFSLIPMFGSYIAFVIGLILIISVNPIQAIYFSVIFFLVCNIEGNVIYPRIIGSSIGLPGVWVLAAVTIGANMYGIAGMLFSVPVVALIYTLLSENSQKILKDKPEVIEKIEEAPDWKYYNYQTHVFEKDPVVIKNVFTPKEEEEPIKKLVTKSKKK